MSDPFNENYMPIENGIKSITVSKLEDCISAAIAETIGCSKLACHIARLEISGMHSVKIKMELSNDDDM